MTLPAILDATALIAGGAATTTLGLYQGAGGISGVTKAWSRVPDSVEPYTHVSYPARGTFEKPETGVQFEIVSHTIPMRLFVAKYGPTSEQSINDLLPFLDRYVRAFSAKATLGNTVEQASITAYSSGVYRFTGAEWLVFEFTYEVWEVDTTIRYTAG